MTTAPTSRLCCLSVPGSDPAKIARARRIDGEMLDEATRVGAQRVLARAVPA